MIRRLALLLAVTAALVAAVPAGATGPALRGVQLHSLWHELSLTDMDRELDLAAAAGSNVVRVDVVWGSLETAGKGRYEPVYVARLERFMRGAAARGMKVVATLWSTPCWASSAPEALKQGCEGDWWERNVGAYPPTDAADYADVAQWLTARYGSQLAALEVWNEPNITTTDRFWQTNDRVGDYAALLRAAYPAAKRGDPRVPVIAGALAFADRPFLEQLYAAGIAAYSDGISVHPYNEWRDPADRWKWQWRKYTLVPGLRDIRAAMRAAGDRSAIWVTELGWTTGGASTWTVTRDQQAAYVARAFRLLAGMKGIAMASVYNLVATSADPLDFEGGFGLVEPDYTPRPAYAALTAALRSPRLKPLSADPRRRPVPGAVRPPR